MIDGKLKINPSIPSTWNELKFSIHWKSDVLEVNITKDKLYIQNTTNNKEVSFIHENKEYTLVNDITIELKKATSLA